MEQPTHRSRELLQPPRRSWWWLTLIVSLVLDLVPRPQGWFWPEFTLLTLSFWALRAPAWTGMAAALLVGTLLDVGRGVVLGQHALMFIGTIWAVQTWRSRILWFGAWGQALHLLPIWALAIALEAVLRWQMTPGAEGGVMVWLTPLLMTAVWPLWQALLLWPQRRPRNESLVA